MNNQKNEQNDYRRFADYIQAMPAAKQILVTGHENIAAAGQQAYAETTKVVAPRLSQLAMGFTEIMQPALAPLALVAAANEVAKVIKMESARPAGKSGTPFNPKPGM